MHMTPALAVIVLWIGFALSWIAAMPWSSKVEKRVGMGREIAYRIVLIVGGLIFLVPAHGYEGPLRLWYLPWLTVWPTVGLIVVGIAFSWWARIWLGALWSGQVTKKANHRVVDTGPYRIVRHPIYTGILLAIYATMALKGTLLAIAGALLITLGIWMKARLEERFLREELGPDYDAYRARVPMLLPFGVKGR
jgi:protein-S-isoprenylcysteine O-methyltransferase Ste14